MKKGVYVILCVLLLFPSCSLHHRNVTKQQDVVTVSLPQRVLAGAKDMDLPQLADYYKENQYDFLRDTIIKEILLSDKSIDELEAAAELFYFEKKYTKTFNEALREKKSVCLKRQVKWICICCLIITKRIDTISLEMPSF
jgi:hypothetical protein